MKGHEKIVRISKVTDFSGKAYNVYDFKNGYEIISEDNIFIEGSYKTNSPFFNHDYLKYYMGPGNYFYEDDEYFIGYLDDTKLFKEDYIGLSLHIEENNLVEELPDNELNEINSLFENDDYFVTITNSNYFENLSDFPNNRFGDCGLVALSILLGYFDTFYNDNVLPNDYLYDGSLLYTVEEQPYISRQYYYPTSMWNNSPGTTQALHSLLFDNCLTTLFGISDDDDGNPITSSIARTIFEDYFDYIGSDLFQNFDLNYCTGLNSLMHIKSSINANLPVFVTSFLDFDNIDWSDLSMELFCHDFICYGYSGNYLLAHTGWNSGTTNSSSYIFNGALIVYIDDVAIAYRGECQHVHSKNAFELDGNGRRVYLCGCGYVSCLSHCYEYEYYNSLCHIKRCESCTFQDYENHSVLRNTNALGPRICSKCGRMFGNTI